MLITGSQVRGARGLLNWSQDNLAAISKVSRRTVQLIERDSSARVGKAQTRLLPTALKKGLIYAICVKWQITHHP